MPPPGDGEAIGFAGFVAYVLQQKASLGALLEHAIPITADEEWPRAAEVKIGFRKNHSFYKAQAEHRVNFEQLERILSAFLQRKLKLVIEFTADSAAALKAGAPAPTSFVEKEKKIQADSAAEKKKKFLEHAIVADTKEIFGAELSSFDIDKVPN
ncbi:MAG: hypothetical protein EOP11_16540 [Proteobacteria bacterium]|nr:MAG: hypothetical protein EOP11_16540 [Pseudomonadota bacterium]